MYREGRSKVQSQIPIRLDKIKEENIDNEILRTGIISELDAINPYEQMAAKTDDKDIKAVHLDIAMEEKTYVREFLSLLLKGDTENDKGMEERREEVEELTHT